MKARRITYVGRVQGVGFRYSARQIAMGFDVSGYVANLPDGTVEIWLQGNPEEISVMEKAVMDSHLGGLIRETNASDVKPDPTIKGFQIRS